MRDERELLAQITEYLIVHRLQRERRRNDWCDERVARDVADELIDELNRQGVQVVRMHAVWRRLDE